MEAEVASCGVGSRVERLDDLILDFEFVAGSIVELFLRNFQQLSDIAADLRELYAIMPVGSSQILYSRFQSVLKARVAEAGGRKLLGFRLQRKLESKFDNDCYKDSLPCLRALCAYDSKNSSVYALMWAGILNRMSFELSSEMDATEEEKLRVRWTMFEKIGRILFAHRHSNLFTGGLSFAGLELVLQTRQSFALFCTPIASVVGEGKGLLIRPDYIESMEVLRQQMLQLLKPLQGSPCDSRAAALHHDLLALLQNFSLIGRGGAVIRARFPLSFRQSETGDPVSLLKKYDAVCGTQFSSSAQAVFTKIAEVVSSAVEGSF